MPKGDLRVKGDALDPLSAAKVLAVMCHPLDVRSREAMLRRTPGRIIIPRDQRQTEGPGDAQRHDLQAAFLDHCRPGCLAGALTLALAQTAVPKRQVEPAAVLQLAIRFAGQLAQVAGLEASTQGGGLAATPSEAEVCGAFQDYRSVSHLWAALVYGKLKLGQDIEPVSTQNLPTFLAYAEEIATLATSIGGQTGERGLGLVAEDLWSFVLPLALRKTASAKTIEPSPGPRVTGAHSDANPRPANSR